MKPPDVKALILEHLPDVVGAPVVSTRPDNGVAKFVRVIGTGGPGRSNRILQTVQVTIDSYASSTGGAFSLAADVDAWVHSLPSSPLPINSIASGTTPADYPDPDTGSPRYTATYQLVVVCH